ncbi:MAG: isopenicillin N synthase family dioxygenase [Oligoflexus sp.]
MSQSKQSIQIPVIDISSLISWKNSKRQTAKEIRRACTEHGFFYISHHGIPFRLQSELERLSHKFFAQSHEAKMDIEMPRAGIAWRGYFPVGSELTSGQADLKEGLYFGEDLPSHHPLVQAKTPMHGANLYPEIPGFRETITSYLSNMSLLGQRLMQGIALSLDLPEDYFYWHYTENPLLLFRIFHYPAANNSVEQIPWGVGEHTDYGLLTILRQDEQGGLEVKSGHQWIAAPPIANTFICNIGDMLDRMTGGFYRSTPHRVLNQSGKSRLSWPFFFDPNFSAEVRALPITQQVNDDYQQRWDKTNIHSFKGTYGDYLLSKVGKVFPELASTTNK